jgi:enoyl-CoA hydratase
MSYQTVQVEIVDSIGIITLNRPKALNAINTQMVEELGKVLDSWMDMQLRAVILTGEGKAFAAGADISQMSEFTATQAQQFALRGQRVLRKLEHFPAPTIAAVNGFALGGGCELAMCCDIILAAPKAKFGQPEVNLGVIPGFGGTQRLVRRVGRQAALELMMTGRIVRSDEAVALGIALRIEEDVLSGAKVLAETIAQKGPVAIRLVKEVVDSTDRVDLDVGLSAEAGAFGLCFATQDQTEGMQAFLEKRTAKFTGH